MLKNDREKHDWFDREHSKFTQKINSLKALNDQLNSRINDQSTAEEELSNANVNLETATSQLMTLRNDFDHLNKQCLQLESHNTRLQTELKQSQTALVDCADQEQAKFEDKVIAL